MSIELMTDDEALREQGMTSGPQIVGKLLMRPMTPVSLSWLQRNHVFDDEYGDSIQKTAAFTFLHSEPKQVIRAVVNNRAAFSDAVDDWIEANFKHHSELDEYVRHMTVAMQVYLSVITTVPKEILPSIEGGIIPPKN